MMQHVGLCSLDTWLKISWKSAPRGLYTSYPMIYNIDKKCHVDYEVVKKRALVLTRKMLDVTSKFPA
jgi:lipopolysaccharide biosynthesis protein